MKDFAVFPLFLTYEHKMNLGPLMPEGFLAFSHPEVKTTTTKGAVLHFRQTLMLICVTKRSVVSLVIFAEPWPLVFKPYVISGETPHQVLKIIFLSSSIRFIVLQLHNLEKKTHFFVLGLLKSQAAARRNCEAFGKTENVLQKKWSSRLHSAASL